MLKKQVIKWDKILRILIGDTYVKGNSKRAK